MTDFLVLDFYDYSAISSGLVPDSGQILLSIYLFPRRTVNPRWLRNFARERIRELLELEQKDSRADAKPNAAWRQAYELPKNYTPVNFIVEDEESGKRYRAKIYIERFSQSPPPLLMRSQDRCPEWRDTQKAARHRNYSGQSSLHAEADAIFYSISSAGCDGCSGQRRKIAMKKKKTRLTPVV